jgi:hypothetical protein
VRLYRAWELGEFLSRAGLSHVMFRTLSGGGFALVRGSAPAGSKAASGVHLAERQ